ncbi:MAG: hypothetical protein ABIR54_16385 [Burkholderiaceae bacterium]|jgi:hypothetical protein
MTLDELASDVRDRFPTISEAADRLYERKFGPPVYTYSWFEALADGVNAEMTCGTDPKSHDALIAYLENALHSSDEVFKCLDVAFVENLFWQVPVRKAEPYWQRLPAKMKALYEGFHHRTPLD